MNLDVTVRLIDQMSRPGRDASAALDRVGASAARITARAERATRALGGLARAMREVAGVDAATARATAATGSLRGLMTAIGPAGRAASSGMGAAARAADRLATAAGKAAGEAGRLHDVLAKGMPGVGFLGAAQTQMAALVASQRQALSNMRALGSASGGGGRQRPGIGGGGTGSHLPGLFLGFQPNGHEALRGVYEQATSLEDAIVKMHLNGLSDSEIAAVRGKAEEVARANKSTNPLSNINAIMEARLALGGDLNEALATAGEMSKLRTIVGFALGKDRAKAAEDGVYDMLRTGELRGVINDPARRNGLFRGMTAALIASNGRITPEQWHKTAIYGRSATQGLSDDFVNGRLPFLMQELQGGRGGPAGVALQALFRAIPLAIGKSSNIAEWRKLGLLDESKVLKGRHGEDKSMQPGAIKLDFANPDQAALTVLDRVKAAGITDRGGIVQEFARLIGPGTGQTAIDVLALQRSRLDNFTRTLNQVEDSETLFGQINATASQSVTNLNVQFDALKGNIGSSVLPMFTALTEGAGRFLGLIDVAAARVGQNGNDPVSGRQVGLASWVGLSAAVAAATVGVSQLASKFPWLGRVMTFGAGQVVSSGLLGGALSSFVSGPMTRVFASIARLGTPAFWQGVLAVLAYRAADVGLHAVAPQTMGTLDRVDNWLAGPKLDTLQHVGMMNRARRFIFGDFGDMASAFTAPTDRFPRLAGKRARGGPVGGGLSYLVGENGPEIFTPGSSGGITNNGLTRRVLGQTDDKTPREIRYMGATLAYSIDNLTRSVDRLNRNGKNDDGGLSGNAAGGDTDGSGFTAGGRRGFMRRGSGDGGPLDNAERLVGQGAVKGGIKDRAMRAMARLVGHGWTPEAAATAIGQAVQESGVKSDGRLGDTKRFGFGDNAAHGMFQWRAQRFRNLKAFADKRGKDWKDFDTQVDFFDAEARKSYHGNAWSKERDLSRGNLFGKHFEGYGDNSFGTRLANAHKLIGAWQNGGAPAVPGQLPAALSDRAADKAKAERDADEKKPKGAGMTMNVTNHIHVSAHPHHDEKKIAAAVHERFNSAVNSQLTDGIFG